jgi:hypothetical protein
MNEEFPKERPLGVTILVILLFLSVSGTLLSFALVVGYPSIASAVQSVRSLLLWPLWPFGILGIIVYLVLAYGLYNGESWAWSLSLFFSIVYAICLPLSIMLISGFLRAIFGISVSLSLSTLIGWSIDIIIAMIIIYYLTRFHVKAFFGKQKYSLMEWFLGKKKIR